MTPSNYTKAIELFSSKVNLLILDDDAGLCKSLCGVFASPLFNITIVTTLDQAYAVIGRMHCWIVDVDLGKGRSGLDLFKNRPRFPFAIVLSGLRSMGIASTAMKLGARIVLDKNPASFDQLIDEVCKNAALGYVLNGKDTPNIDMFLLLQDSAITTVEQWAEKACMPVRKLQRICELHQPLTPRYALALYRTLYCLLWHIPGVSPDGSLHEGFGPDPRQKELYDSSIEYIVRKTGR